MIMRIRTDNRIVDIDLRNKKKAVVKLLKFYNYVYGGYEVVEYRRVAK